MRLISKIRGTLARGAIYWQPLVLLLVVFSGSGAKAADPVLPVKATARER